MATSDERLAEIADRAERATPGPWLAVTDNNRKSGIGIVGRKEDRGTGKAIAVFAAVGSHQRNADARFTAAAREDIPFLLSEIDKLNAEKAETIEGLEGLAEEMFNDGDTHVSYYAEEILNPLLDKLKGGS